MLLLLAYKKEPEKPKYFEGYVDYKVETVALDTSREAYQYVKQVSKFMRRYCKNGNYLREYFDSNNVSTAKILYQATNNRFVYMIGHSPNNYFKQQEEEVRKDCRITGSNFTKTVLGISCAGFQGSYTIAAQKPSTIIMTYYFANTLPFDYSNFRNSPDPFVHYFSNRFPFIALYFTEENIGKTKTTHTATRIVSMPLSDTLFTVPNDKPLIHFPD